MYRTIVNLGFRVADRALPKYGVAFAMLERDRLQSDPHHQDAERNRAQGAGEICPGTSDRFRAVRASPNHSTPNAPKLRLGDGADLACAEVLLRMAGVPPRRAARYVRAASATS
jgi:hypothetical protein